MNLNRTINLNKKFIVLLLLVNIIGLTLYYSYALFQVNVIHNGAITLKTISLPNILTTLDVGDSTGLTSFTVPAGNSVEVVVHLSTDNNQISSAIAYKMFYEVTDGYGTFNVTLPNNSEEVFNDNKVEGSFTRTKTFTLVFNNTGSNPLTISLGATSGYEAEGAVLTTQSELVLNTNITKERPGINAEQLIAKVSIPSTAPTQEETCDGTKDGLIAINTNGQLALTGDTIREYRYSGGEGCVKNYITFNNEDWRIIGIFDSDNNMSNGCQNCRIKIVKDTPIASAPTSYTNKNDDTEFALQESTSTWAGVQVSQMFWNKDGGTRANLNDWSEAGLMYYLNEENSKASNSYYDTMSSNYKIFIDDTTYYLGKVIYNKATPSQAYTQERDTSSSNIWGGNAPDWTGKIGLMYPSDWGYATDPFVWNGTTKEMYYYDGVGIGIKTKNWILKVNDMSGSYWLISPSSSFSERAMDWKFSGCVYVDYVDISGGVRPVLNLISGTKIVSGEGTSNNQYKLIEEN